jgi:hypothetical protein
VGIAYVNMPSVANAHRDQPASALPMVAAAAVHFLDAIKAPVTSSSVQRTAVASAVEWMVARNPQLVAQNSVQRTVEGVVALSKVATNRLNRQLNIVSSTVAARNVPRKDAKK